MKFKATFRRSFVVAIVLACFFIDLVSYAVDVTALTPGTEIHYQGSTYVVERFLGKGGFGVTYRVVESDTARERVMRIVHRPDAGDEAFSRRLDELFARETVQSSPHLLKYTSLGKGAIGEVTAAMQLTEEVTPLLALKEELNLSTTLDPSAMALRVESLLSIFIQGAAGISVLAEQGYVHRDIKGNNLGITGSLKEFRDGQAHLVLYDYDLLDKVKLDNSDNAFGHPQFMAPEAFALPSRPTSAVVSSMLDIFALAVSLVDLAFGVMFYELADLQDLPSDAFMLAHDEANWETRLHLPVRERFARIKRQIMVAAEAQTQPALINGLDQLEALIIAATHPDPVTRLNLLVSERSSVPKAVKRSLSESFWRAFPMLGSGDCMVMRNEAEQRLRSAVVFGRRPPQKAVNDAVFKNRTEMPPALIQEGRPPPL